MELRLEHVTKAYKTKRAVDDFSLELEPGLHALLGANGSGKTTLMRMICGLLRADKGKITIDGLDISKAGEGYREMLGYLPQNFGYYPNFTAWEFMMYLAALKGLPKAMAQERSGELLEQMGLYAVRKKKLKTFSGGMLQRAGIAQALLGDPKILVLDEPTAGLDPKERVRFRELLESLRGDRIILLSTHIVSDVEAVAEDVMIMKEGRLVYRGCRHEGLEELYLSYFGDSTDFNKVRGTDAADEEVTR